MSQPISLKDTEQKLFTAAYNDGLWDIFLGCVLLMFAVAPYLSESLGDFWSSAVFLPFWALVYLIIWSLRRYVVLPRIGRVRFGQARVKKLTKFTLVMLGANIAILVLGIVVALSFTRLPGQLTSILFGLVLLVLFSLAGHFLGFKRLYVYGLLIGLSPLVGEWLWSQGYASHHGFPITFGPLAGATILTGLAIFICLLRANPLSPQSLPLEEA